MTIVDLNGTVLIADGDKTALAALLYAAESGQPDFVLKVFLAATPRASPADPSRSGEGGDVSPL